MTTKKQTKFSGFFLQVTLFIAAMYYAITPFLWRSHELTAPVVVIDPSLNLIAWLGLLASSVPVFATAYYLLSRFTVFSISIGALLLNSAAMIAGAGMRFIAY